MWEKLVNEIDFKLFHKILERLRNQRIAEAYSMELWKIFPNPVDLRKRLKGEFPEFVRLATTRIGLCGTHEDLVP